MMHLLLDDAQTIPSVATPPAPHLMSASERACRRTVAVHATDISSPRAEPVPSARWHEFSLPTTLTVRAVEALVLAVMAAYFVCGFFAALLGL